MKITYDLNQEDYWQLYKFAMPSFKLALIATSLIMSYVSAIVFSDLGIPLIATVALALGVLAATPLLMIALWKRGIRKQVSGQGFLGEHSIVIGPNGCQEETAVNQSSFSWAGVTDIAQNDNYIFIFIGKYMAHVIPKRAFSRSEEAGAFFEQAESFWKEAAGA